MDKPPKHFLCGHCDRSLSKTVFYQHRRLYYKSTANEWCKSRLFLESCGEPSFTVPDNELEDATSVQEPSFTLSEDEYDTDQGISKTRNRYVATTLLALNIRINVNSNNIRYTAEYLGR